MKILIPTDFSVYSDHAIDFGCQLAQMTDAELILFHCEDPDTADQIFEFKDDKQAKLVEKINDYRKDKLKNQTITICETGIRATSKLVSGNFLFEVSKFIDVANIDLVIMGSHGHSGLEKLLLGSHTLDVLRHISINTIVIKSKVDLFEFDQIVFVSSLELRDKSAFEEMNIFLTPFNVKNIHLLTVDTSGVFSQPSFAMKAALEDFAQGSNSITVQTHFKHDSGVVKGIQSFCDAHSIDLIVMPNHEKSAFWRMLKGSPLEKIIYRSSIPVISIPCK